MAPPLELLVVAHTHWDREWYHPAPRFQQRLVALVDELLDAPPTPPGGFVLDGQAILIEDYLAIRPERTAELASLLRDGRIEAGPWLVLADHLIPSGEALVRNLLAGRDVLRRLRAGSPPVLYCPDSFGHPASLPDIARGFGCELVVLWRGYGGARWPAGDVARWTGAAGAQVLVYHLPPDGYESGSSLPTTPAAAAARWERLRDTLVRRASTSVALLLNGADHHARQRDLPGAVAALADAAAPVVLRASTLRNASEAVVHAAALVALPAVRGELRDSYGYAWTLQGTLASRAAQKRRNAIAERRLLRDVEPWIALATRGGDDGARALLRSAWRGLLESHPHDTLCGTSIDEVAAALDQRLADTDVRSRGLRDDAVQSLLGHDAEAARRAPDAWKPVVVLRNCAARARGGVVELVLRTTLAGVSVGPGSAARQGERRRRHSPAVAGVSIQPIGRRERVELTESPRDYPKADLVLETRAVGWVEAIGAYSLESRAQSRSGEAAAPSVPVRADARSLDNGLLRVSVSPAGRVRLEDLASGRSVDDAVRLEDDVDVGDLYTPAIRERLPDARARRVRCVHRGPLRGELAIEFEGSRARGRTLNRCRVSLGLDAGAAFVRVRVEGSNGAHDHRLRVRLATGLAGATTLADAAFHPVPREPLDLAPGECIEEHVVPTAPLHRWVTRFTSWAGATIVSDGLAEYESASDGSVAVTLLRAVGSLSRADLPERPGHAGWPADTPAAQSLGPHRAELAIAFHGPDGPETRDAIERIADDVLLPLVGATLRSNLADPLAAGGLELIGAGLAFSAAMPAREPGWVVLRCVNRRDDAVRGEWRTARAIESASVARLDETPIGTTEVRADGHGVGFTAPARAIVTLLVRWRDDR